MRAAPCLLPLPLVASGAPLPDDLPDAPPDTPSDTAPAVDVAPPADAVTPLDAAVPLDHPASSDIPPSSDIPLSVDRPDSSDVPSAPDVPSTPDIPSTRDTPPTPDAPAPPPGPVLYPAPQRHSPITPDLVTRLRAISARGATLVDNVFSKVGDSITVSTSFMACFASTTAVDLGGRDHLRPTLDLYRAGSVGGTDPYRRVSLAATVGQGGVPGAPADAHGSALCVVALSLFCYLPLALLARALGVGDRWLLAFVVLCDVAVIALYVACSVSLVRAPGATLRSLGETPPACGPMALVASIALPILLVPVEITLLSSATILPRVGLGLILALGLAAEVAVVLALAAVMGRAARALARQESPESALH